MSDPKVITFGFQLISPTAMDNDELFAAQVVLQNDQSNMSLDVWR